VGQRSGRFPRQVVPFARDGDGSAVCLDLTGKGRGRVVAYVLGLPAGTGCGQADALVTVAPDFERYLAALEYDERDTGRTGRRHPGQTDATMPPAGALWPRRPRAVVAGWGPWGCAGPREAGYGGCRSRARAVR
jgi:hypothetical protein